LGGGLELGEVARDQDIDYPDEIECQLIQKNVLINGQVQAIDFIMCNQCPRLFRTEALLWTHIKEKHKRRSYRRSGQGGGSYSISPNRGLASMHREGGSLEPGEIMTHSSNQADHHEFQGEANKDGPVYVVGLEKGGMSTQDMLEEQEMMAGVIRTEKYQRQRSRKRIYVDSSHGPFKCPGCDIVTFSNRRALDLHMKRVHKAGILECDECGRKVLDLKRHKEILHKRFKIYNCPHCNDKYCTQEDLERHLMKVEMNNFVTDRGTVVNTSRPVDPTEVQTENDENSEGIGIGGNATHEELSINSVETAAENTNPEEIMKEMEKKTFTCSECGLKTPSRMTYIQHVLNGCIMDMVLGETGDGGEENTPVKGGSGRGRGKKRGISHVAPSQASDGAPKKRGRPFGSKNKTTLNNIKVFNNGIEDNQNAIPIESEERD